MVRLIKIMVGLTLILLASSCQRKALTLDAKKTDPKVSSGTHSIQHVTSEDLQLHACDCVNAGAILLESGDIEAGLTYFDEVVFLMNTYEQSISASPESSRFFQVLLREMREMEALLVLGLPGDIENFEGQESIAVDLAIQELDSDLVQELIDDPGHFFFDAWEMENPKTASFLHNFSDQNSKSIRASLERGSQYLPMIRSIFEEECLPEDLCFLPLIESGYRTTVRSIAKAVGMWQFVEGTAKMMGLTVNWWVDERRDPEASTRAAARYLNYLYEEYNDWYLALVAYNAGPGRVNRAIRKGGSRNFWELSRKRLLPRESRNYIPAFMAAVTIAKNPENFGFNELQYQEPELFSHVEVDFSIELNRLAAELGLDASCLTRLNPALRHGVTPGGNPPYQIRVPVGLRDKASYALNQIPVQERVQWKQYRIRKGDTLGRIARKFSVSIYALKTVNGISNPRRLRIGQRLIIPFGPEDQVIKMAHMGTKRTYRVRRGDTLSRIALKMHTSVSALLRRNPGLQPKKIRPGQVIVIGGSQQGSNAKQITNEHGGYFWIVKRGDNLYDIARKCGTTVRKICAENGISDSKTLHPGNRLRLPADTGLKSHHYAIRKGDTLSKIAKKFSVKLSDLMAWNQIGSKNILQIGQQIIVYR